MDGWPAGRRHKRSFTEMSHQATLSPSPVIFRDPALSGFSSDTRFSAPSNDFSGFERRRTSHPHNPPHFVSRASEDMPDRSQSQQRPRLEHRASQTVIDLTDEPEDIHQPAPSRHRGQRARSQRPPQLGRSDAALDLLDIVDLTSDEQPSPEVQFTHSRELPRPAQEPTRDVPNLHIPPHLPPLRLRDNSPFWLVPPGPAHQLAQHQQNRTMFHAFGGFGQAMDRIGQFLDRNAHHRQFAFDADVNQQPMQPMPGQMNYQNPAFPHRNDRNTKPDHRPPQAARPGFTRSPAEHDTVICPSCEQELVHRKDIEQPVVKRSGKTLNKKEREEHPFWVVRECGHVYCNTCYQHRTTPAKSPVPTTFPIETKGNRKTLLCSVEDCHSDVKNKDKWVGVFL